MGDMCTSISVLGSIEMSEVPFLDMEYDGIMGLGRVGIALNQKFSFLERIKSETMFNSFYIDKIDK